MRQLSKSKIIAFRQCPKRLWLELHRPELRDDSGNEAVFATGNRVGEVARQIYDPLAAGRLIDIEEEGWDAAYKETETWLNQGSSPLFEGALRIPGALALADVLLPIQTQQGTRWRMVEVKSTASLKDYQRDDIAVQAHVAITSGVSLASASVAHIDTSFVYPGGGNYQGLLTEVDLTEEAVARSAEVASWIAEAQVVAALPDEPKADPGPQCSNPFVCSFCAYCQQDQNESEYPLTSFHRLNAGKREAWEAEGYRDIREIPDEWLSDTNRWIKEQTAKGETWFDAEGASSELAEYAGPWRFVDFETIAFAVPIWAGTSPYKQIPFQFSLHLVEDGQPLHHQAFLDLSGNDPRSTLVQDLIAACGDTGPIFAYNASFEKTVMGQLAETFPLLATELHSIIDRVVDLLPVAKRCFYDPSQHGSWSLKAVLPAICPDLDYGSLEGVQNGDMAQQAFLEAIDPMTTPERREQLRLQLHDYCELDTLALVRIWEIFTMRRAR